MKEQKGIWASAVSRFDSWSNSVTGLGTTLKDKMQSYTFGSRGKIDDTQLEALYDEDGLAAKVADSVPEHMLRRSWEVVTPDNPQDGEELKKYLEKFEFTRKITDAKVWERVYGGSALIMGFDDGRDIGEPLDEDNIKGLLFINVMEKRDVLPYQYYADPRKPKFAEPATYRVHYYVGGTPRQEDYAAGAGMQLVVHESRMLVFRGGRTTIRGRIKNNGWGSSVLSKCYNELRAHGANWQAVENMLQDASQGVFKIKGLAGIISSGNLSLLQTRLSLVNMGRSVAQAIVIDGDKEDFERKDTTMSGLPDLLDRTMVRLSAVARVPVTVLNGISPAGLNATGESDMRNWYDSLESERTQSLLPPMERAVHLAAKCKDGPTKGVKPDNLSITFPALWQQTDQEKAATSATQTQSDTALIQAGVIIPEEVRVRRAKELGVDPASSLDAIQKYNQAIAKGEGSLDNPGTDTPVEKVEEFSSGKEKQPTNPTSPVSGPVQPKEEEGSSKTT